VSASGEGQAAGESISVVLADDHAVVRSALRLMLERESDIEVVAGRVMPIRQRATSADTIPRS
jgi:chemotaxis response regulator CheB